MNDIGTSQLDIFLNFTELHLLVFTAQWKLVDLHPNHHNFLGWDESTLSSFKFSHNFLEPNHLDIQEFLGHFQQKEFAIKNYYWRNVNEQVSGPYETYFRIKKERGQIKSLTAFVKLSENTDKIEIPPQEKYHIFLSQLLPGLIHNLNGPLGTITGRIELLSYKYQDIKEFDELLKMGFKLQANLENLSFKLVNERYLQPVEINLNRFLREEINFLNCDLFFKHQVEKKEKFTLNIPQFSMPYLALSGVWSECYHFFRRFVFEDQEYVMHIGSLYENRNTGFYLKVLGEFHIPDDLGLRFPFTLEGNATKIAQQKVEGLDSAFLSFCLKNNRGYLQVSCRKEVLTMKLMFPLP